MQDFKAKVAEIKQLAPDTVELRVDLVEPLMVEFSAGQFMQFKIGQDLRSYSIVSLPDHNKALKFCVEILPQGVGSNFVRSLKAGDEIAMRGPSGVFTYTHFDRDAVFVATGVGVAPFVSVISDMLAKNYQGKVKLLFGLRHESDIFYFEVFAELAKQHANFEFTPTLSRPGGTWQGHTGRVTKYLEERYNEYKDRMFYICGSMAMIKDVRHLLMGKGHANKDIKLEIFT